MKKISIWKSEFPLMKKELHSKFLDMWKEGKCFKRSWFNSKARELVKEKYSGKVSTLNLSHNQFKGFCRRHEISLWRKVHTAQKSPLALRSAIEHFNAKFLRKRKRGSYTHDLANMDQTPLPFVKDDITTYEKTGTNEVWIASGQSGLEKRRCYVI